MKKLFWQLRALYILVCGLSVLTGGAALAQETVSVDLARNTVDITTGFTGEDIILYGVKPIRGDIAVIVEGPRKDVTVRRKENVFGAWINRRSVTYKNVPLYYDYAVSSPDKGDYRDLDIGPEAIELVAEQKDLAEEERKIFKNAFLEEKMRLGYYYKKPKAVELLDRSFFKVIMHLPANVPKGEYSVNVLLLKGGSVVHKTVKSFRVGQVGFSAKIYAYAQNHGFFYALITVFIAISAGWVSNRLARRS